MLQAALFSLAALTISASAVWQVSLPQSSHHWQDVPQGTLSLDEPTQWNLDEIPNSNATDHLVFETVYSLLQHWPNVRMRNGHNIVPGIIPAGTLLYHGTDSKTIPKGVEWAALDFEHAYVFCWRKRSLGLSQNGCWQLTLTTTRPLKVVYFDGKSAAKIPGALDTQDLLAFGESRTEDIGDEVRRGEALCRWGKNVGVDGFVRMEMAFEVILCDFTSGVSVVSFSNIVWQFGLPPEKSETFTMFESLKAGGRHNHFPGETRVKLDLAGLVSFYDTELVPSLVPIRAGQERWDHRVQDVAKDDLLAAVSRLESAVTRPSGRSSGIDWETLIQVIVDQYAGRLELTQHLINSTITSPDEIIDLAIKTQTQLRIMLTPYIRVSVAPMDVSDKNSVDWTIPIYRDCATTHVKFVASRLDSLTNSERLLLRAVRGTNREICRVVTKMWAAGVYAGIDPSLNTKDFVDVTEVTHVWRIWAHDLDRLMGWLDWNVWIKCRPGCGPEEICFLHLWPSPFNPFPTLQAGNGHTTNWLAKVDGESAIESFLEGPFRPQPRCVSLVDP